MQTAHKIIHEVRRFVNYPEKYVLRFHSKFKKGRKNECWNYLAYKDRQGYGLFSIKRKTVRAHRFAFAIFYKKINPDMAICHKCDNPSCVNPNHLYEGTWKENLADMRRKGRYGFGEKSNFSKLKEFQVREIFRLDTETKMKKKEIAAKFKICNGTVRDIRIGKNWCHLNLTSKR